MPAFLFISIRNLGCLIQFICKLKYQINKTHYEKV
jgi:hypothetical protein